MVQITQPVDHFTLSKCPSLIPSCITDKDNEQRANKAEIKNKTCNLKYQC